MVRTRVGYAGGTSADPTYRQIGDHTETIQIDYDPSIISYEQLLEVFWEAHNPHVRSWSKQYQSMILFHSEAQRQAAEAGAASVAEERGLAVATVIQPYDRFYLAEYYHQKYTLQRYLELSRLLRRIYPSEAAFIDATVTARLNGYLAGYGEIEDLVAELEGFGLTLEQQSEILKGVGAGQFCPTG